MLDEVKFGSKTQTKEKNVSFLLSAHHDPLAAVVCLSQHVVLADVNNDGESKLVIGHINDGQSGFKLKLFSKTSLVQSPSLLALPSAVVDFKISNGITAIAVASMNNIFIYKSMKPYFKYTLPTMDLNQVEKEAWIQSRDDKFDPDMLYDILSNLNSENSSVPLSQRSKTFLKIPRGSDESLQFLEKHKNSALTRHSSIVAMASMKKNINDENGLSILIVATEEKELLFLDVEAFTILKKIQLPSVAVFIGTNGLFDVEFQISIISRDGHCYTMNRDTEIPKDLFSMKTHSVGLIHQGRFIYTANTDATFHSYSTKGHVNFIRSLASNPTCIEQMFIKSKSMNLIAIALDNKTITVWNEGDIVDTVETRDIVVAMKFGSYNREDATLITVYANGALEIHIIRRKANFTKKQNDQISRTHENIKMPKMTSSYVDQARYEAENSKEIFNRMQYDLADMKLTSLRELIKIEKKSLSPISSKEPITMSVGLLGVGPVFKLRLTVTNTGNDINVTDRYRLFFLYNSQLYSVEQKTSSLPLLIPDQSQVIDTFVRALSPDGVTGSIRISISKNSDSKPFISTILNMPPAEIFAT